MPKGEKSARDEERAADPLGSGSDVVTDAAALAGNGVGSDSLSRAPLCQMLLPVLCHSVQ